MRSSPNRPRRLIGNNSEEAPAVRPAAAVTVREVVGRVPEWRRRSVAIAPLAGGLTNANYRVTVEGQDFVVRIPGAATELLAIDREEERRNTEIAAEAGVGAALRHYFPDCQAMVLEFIPGRTMTGADLRTPGMPARVAQAARRLHQARPFGRDFDMLALAGRYREVATVRGIPLPADYDVRRPLVDRIGQALGTHPLPRVPCHNDLLPENFIDDGRTLRIVDYEYSGNNDPAFELGDAAVELAYDEARIAELCQAYFGQASPRHLARVHLNMIVSDVGWSLWAAIQATISRIAFDFPGYGRDRWVRACRLLDAPELPGWLDAARRGP